MIPQGSIRNHLPALLLCMLAAMFLATLPHWLGLAHWHRPIWIADHDEMFYLAIVGQAYDNHILRLTEPMLVNGLQSPYPWIQMIPGIVLAKAAGLGPLAVGLIWRAMGAAFISATYYLLTYRITRIKALAVCLTVSICADVGVLYSMPLLRQIWLVVSFLNGHGQGFLATYPKIAPSWRIVTPTLSLGYLLLFIWLLGRALERFEWRRIIAAGVACGLLFYVYFYFVIAVGLGLFLNMLIDARRRWTYFFTGLVGLICGLPNVLAQSALSMSTSSDWLHRWDMFVTIPRTSELLIPKVAILYSCLCLFWCLLRARQLLYLWVFAFSALLLLNHQLLTSLQIQNYHWLYTIGPVHAVLLVALVWNEILRRPSWKRNYLASVYVMTPVIFLSGLWLRGIEATQTQESQSILHDLEHYEQMRFSPEGRASPLVPNAFVAGQQDFVDIASVLENQRPLIHYTVLSSPSIDDREWDERAALSGYLQAISRADFATGQRLDLEINLPRSAAVRASRLAGRLAAFDQISADPRPWLGRYPVRYVAVKPSGIPTEFAVKLRMQPLQRGPYWDLWRLP